MAYEIKMPVLKEAVGALRQLFGDDNGRIIIGACTGVSRLVETDLKTRLAKNKLDKIEAKAADAE